MADNNGNLVLIPSTAENLNEILKNDLDYLIICSYYELHGNLSEKHRNTLASIIIKSLLSNHPERDITPSELKKITGAISLKFENELPTIYYEYSSTLRQVKGKLDSSIKHFKKLLKEVKLFEPRQYNRSCSEFVVVNLPEIESDTNPEQALLVWNDTFLRRVDFVKKNYSSYIEKYGIFYADIQFWNLDFESSNIKEITNKWQEAKDKLVQHFEKKPNADSETILRAMEQNVCRRAQSALAFLLLPLYFPACSKRDGSKTTRKGKGVSFEDFWEHCDELQEKGQEEREKPYIIIVGELTNNYQIQVVISDEIVLKFEDQIEGFEFLFRASFFIDKCPSVLKNVFSFGHKYLIDMADTKVTAKVDQLARNLFQI